MKKEKITPVTEEAVVLVAVEPLAVNQEMVVREITVVLEVFLVAILFHQADLKVMDLVLHQEAQVNLFISQAWQWQDQPQVATGQTVLQ